MYLPKQVQKYLDKQSLSNWNLELNEEKLFSNIIVIPALSEDNNTKLLLDSLTLNSQQHLDNTLILFGSGCSTRHNVKNIPLLLTGGKNLGLQHGRHLNYKDKEMKYDNLHLALLHSLGIKQKKFANSTGVMTDLFTG